jgi:peptidoglycan/xylan/chitin deacetylase (PgdA/CDA1 family)
MNITDALQENNVVWDLFTLKEEYTPDILDKHQRFPSYASHNRDIFKPLASEYLRGRGFALEYPHKAPFAVCLTHDIDWIYQQTWKKGLKTLTSLKSLDIRQSLRSVAEFRSRKLPYCNVREITELEERYGASSTFFFLALKKQDEDFNYPAPDLREEFGYLQEKGAEIGLHGGHTACKDLDTLVEEKKRLENVLGRPVRGYRNHFLKFRIPDTWENLHAAGFQYDSTMGYPDCVGFRNGMCHPFRPYNRTTNKIIDILEFPLVIHDTTLFDYMQLDGNEAWAVTKDLINKTEKNQGVITILWHNTTFLSASGAKFYEKILEYCKAKNAWMTNAGEIAAFWRESVGQ